MSAPKKFDQAKTESKKIISNMSKDSIYQSVLLCVGLVAASYATDMTMGKKYSTSLKPKDIGALSVSVLISRFGLDYLYRMKEEKL